MKAWILTKLGFRQTHCNLCGRLQWKRRYVSIVVCTDCAFEWITSVERERGKKE